MGDLKQRLQDLERRDNKLNFLIKALWTTSADIELCRLLSKFWRGASVEEMVTSVSHAKRTL